MACNYSNKLPELSQVSNNGITPKMRWKKYGPDHIPQFVCVLYFRDGKHFKSDRQPTKKEAKEDACKKAWEHYHSSHKKKKVPLPNQPLRSQNYDPYLSYHVKEQEEQKSDSSSSAKEEDEEEEEEDSSSEKEELCGGLRRLAVNITIMEKLISELRSEVIDMSGNINGK